MIFKRKNICPAILGLLISISLAGQARADLSNGSFEEPDTGPLPTWRYISQDLVPHWQTSASTEIIEIWSNGFEGVSAYEGKQHAELNSDQPSTLFQDVSGIDAGLTVGFEFAHRARVGTDVMRLTITDLGTDNVFGNSDDTALFTKEYSATTLNWEFNTSFGESPIIAIGNDVRFAYEAVSTGSGDLTRGNFIDAANFGVGVAIPEPSCAVLLGIAALSICFTGRRRRPEHTSSATRFCKTRTAPKKLIGYGLLAYILTAGQANADLANGNFEEPDTGPLPSAVFINQSLVPNWETDAASELIEIWSRNFHGVSAYEGNQHAELNSDEASTLFQDVSGIEAGLIVGFEFAHRARIGTDVMRLTITDLGTDNIFGNPDDTTLFTKEYSATTANWEFNTSFGETPIVALGNDVRFAYEAVSTGSGDLTQGNFIDAADFGVGVAVPEPSAVAFLGIVGLALFSRRRRGLRFDDFERAQSRS